MDRHKGRGKNGQEVSDTHEARRDSALSGARRVGESLTCGSDAAGSGLAAAAGVSASRRPQVMAENTLQGGGPRRCAPGGGR